MLISAHRDADRSESRTSESNVDPEGWVRIVSQEGFSYIVKRKVACASQTLKSMLDPDSLSPCLSIQSRLLTSTQAHMLRVVQVSASLQNSEQGQFWGIDILLTLL